jgi:hypothetical protein
LPFGDLEVGPALEPALFAAGDTLAEADRVLVELYSPIERYGKYSGGRVRAAESRENASR